MNADREPLDAADSALASAVAAAPDDLDARYDLAGLAAAVGASTTLLDAGLPLAELLALAGPTDTAVTDVAERAVDAFLRFVRDPVLGTSADGDEAAARLVTAYEQMLPATERLVAHHLRRRLILAALARLAESDGAGVDGAGVDGAA